MKSSKRLSAGLRLVAGTLALFCSAFLFLPIRKKENALAEPVILSVWRIDSFEGGRGSRADCLRRIGRSYQKRKGNVLISVGEQTIDSATEKISKGELPDVLTFSCGLSAAYGYALRLPFGDDFSGYSSDGTYAVAWAYGGYFLFSRGSCERLYVSKKRTTSPYAAAYFSGIELNGAVELSPQKAFDTFKRDEDSALLGTQRDIERLKKTEIKAEITPLSGFTDLIEYAAVLKEERYEESVDFIRYILSDGAEEIKKLGLMPACGDVNIFGDELLEEISRIKATHGTWAFESEERINEINALAAKWQSLSDVELKILKSSFKSLKIN